MAGGINYTHILEAASYYLRVMKSSSIMFPIRSSSFHRFGLQITFFRASHLFPRSESMIFCFVKMKDDDGAGGMKHLFVMAMLLFSILSVETFQICH